jgi:hypothetical protein
VKQIALLTLAIGGLLVPATAHSVPVAWSAADALSPPNPHFTACRTAKRLIVNYRFATFPTSRDRRRPWLLLTSAKSAGWTYPPYTVRTQVFQRAGRVVQPLGRGAAPWRVLLSVYAPSGRRSATISRSLLPCRLP